MRADFGLACTLQSRLQRTPSVRLKPDPYPDTTDLKDQTAGEFRESKISEYWKEKKERDRPKDRIRPS